MAEKDDSLGIDVDHETREIISKVLNIRIVLSMPRLSPKTLIQALNRLESMDITVKILEITEIGRNVNKLRKHGNEEVRNLSRKLISLWRNSVDRWMKETSTANDGLLKPGQASLGEGKAIPAPVAKKMENSEGSSSKVKLEASKRKLNQAYKEVENAKKKRKIQVLELTDLPKIPTIRRYTIPTKAPVAPKRGKNCVPAMFKEKKLRYNGR